MAGPPGAQFSALDLNDRGQLAGAAIDAAGVASAAIWEDDRVTVLDTPSWATSCTGRAINDHADVAGLCFQGSATSAVVWTRKGRLVTIGAAAGAGPYVPTAISNDGLVVGYISGATGFAGGFAWKDGVVVRLDPFVVAEDVNDRARIVGWGEPAGSVTALLHDRHGLRSLPGLFAGAITQAFAINRHGEIAGMSAGDPVVWTGGPPRVLPLLPGGTFALPVDINNRGDVAGHATTPVERIPHAVLWPRAAAQRPDTAID
jgi:probable HAF family extracellular repeat protein